MPLTALEEMLIAHVGTRYVKTGRGARSTFFGIDIQQDVDGHYEDEFVVGGGRFKSSTEDWKPITFSVVQGLTAQAEATHPTFAALLKAASVCVAFTWTDIAATLMLGSRRPGPSILQGFNTSTGAPVKLTTNPHAGGRRAIDTLGAGHCPELGVGSPRAPRDLLRVDGQQGEGEGDVFEPTAGGTGEGDLRFGVPLIMGRLLARKLTLQEYAALADRRTASEDVRRRMGGGLCCF